METVRTDGLHCIVNQTLLAICSTSNNYGLNVAQPFDANMQKSHDTKQWRSHQVTRKNGIKERQEASHISPNCEFVAKRGLNLAKIDASISQKLQNILTGHGDITRGGLAIMNDSAGHKCLQFVGPSLQKHLQK
jgi:hypothetical protein